MLGASIDDPVESGRGSVDGLGLLPVRTTFGADKVLRRSRREISEGMAVEGYEIHHGVVTRSGGVPLFADEGCRVGAVAGTSWHGLFENDGFRRSFLADVASRARRDFVFSPGITFAEVREARFEKLADIVAEHLDTRALLRIIEGHTDAHATLRIGSVDPHGSTRM